MYSKDDFTEMIKDWMADNSPEMDNLVIDNIENNTGTYEAFAHDEKCTYLLTDNGNGDIVINYIGTYAKSWGGYRPGAGAKKQSPPDATRRTFLLTDAEHAKVKEFIERLRRNDQ